MQKKDNEMHELELLQGPIDGFLPQTGLPAQGVDAMPDALAYRHRAVCERIFPLVRGRTQLACRGCPVHADELSMLPEINILATFE